MHHALLATSVNNFIPTIKTVCMSLVYTIYIAYMSVMYTLYKLPTSEGYTNRLDQGLKK